MALPRYQQRPVQLQSGVSQAMQASAQQAQSFVQKVDQFKGMAIQKLGEQQAQQAKADAEKAFTEKGINAETNRDLTVYGKQYSNTLESLHKKQVSIDTGKRFSELFQEYDSNPSAFEELSEAYRKKTLEKLPEHLKAEFAVDFEANKAHYSGKISANRISLNKAEDHRVTLETFNDSFNKATQAIREDKNSPLALYEMTKGINAIEDSYQNGNMTLTERDKLISNMHEGISKANFKGVNDGYIKRGDLEGAQDSIDKFRTTQVEGYSDEGRESLADEMQADLNKELRVLNAESKASQKFDNREAKKLIRLYNDGEEVENATLSTVASGNLSSPVREELALAAVDASKITVFKSLDILDQEQDIKDSKKKTGKTPDELRLIQKKEKAYDKQLKLMDSDPLLYAEGKSFKDKLETLTIKDPSIVDKAANRATQVRKTIDGTGKKRQGLFTKDEISVVKSDLSAMNVDEKIDFIKNINQLDDDIAENTFFQVGGDVMFAGLLTKSNNEAAAKISLLGKNADVQLPDGFTRDLKTKMAGVYSNLPVDFINANIDGITNFAKGSLTMGEELDYDAAIEKSVGIVSEWNSKKTLLPTGVDESKFENWLDNIVIPGKPALTKGLNDMTDFISDSDFQLHYAGQGKYYIKTPNNGSPSFVRGDDGQPFVLDYNEVYE